MPRIKVSTVVKLLIASLVVGMILAWLNVSPHDLIRGVIGEAQAMFERVSGLFGWAMSYVLLGAVIVVPIWLIFYLIRAVKQRR